MIALYTSLAGAFIPFRLPVIQYGRAWRSALPIALATAMGWSSIVAQSVIYPIGSRTVQLPTSTDVFVQLPFLRNPEFHGTCQGLQNNGLHDPGESFTDLNSNGTWDTGEPFVDTHNVLQFDTAAPATNRFVYLAGTQPNHYYALIADGEKEGSTFPVTANDGQTVTINLNGSSIQGNVGPGTSFWITPYHTLSTIFPSQEGVHASTSHSIATRETQVLIPDTTSVGTDLAALDSYYYYSGTAGAGPGWRKSGFAQIIANDTPIKQECFIIVRHRASSAGTKVVLRGFVQPTRLSTVLRISATSDQDNATVLPFVTDATLQQLGIVECGAFIPSESHSITTRQDQLLVWDNTVSGYNKAADTSYYYYGGLNPPGPGWRRSGVANVLANNEIVLSSTRCFIIRKKGGTTPSQIVWSVRPSYLSQ